MDFYSAEVLSTAKRVLMKDIEVMNLSIRLPHVPARRDGENRTAREVDDIIALFTCLDENKLLGELPRYAADGPDSMPSV